MPSSKAFVVCILPCLTACLEPTPIGEFVAVGPISAALGGI